MKQTFKKINHEFKKGQMAAFLSDKKIIKCQCCGFIGIIPRVQNYIELLCSFCYQPGRRCKADFIEINIYELLESIGLIRKE